MNVNSQLPSGRTISLLVLSLLAVSAVQAQESSPAEPDYFGELPLVLTVTRIPQTLAEVPASVTVIDRQMIEASGATEIPDLLRLVPGFQVGHVDGTRTTVTYHGLSDQYARRMQVLVDGRSIYLPATGGVDWQDLPLSIDDIERIEVTRGPNGVTYGANSFLAVINIITFHPDQVLGTTVRHSNSGDNGYRRDEVRHAGRDGDLAYRLTVSHRQFDGYRNTKAQKNNTDTDMLNLRADYRAGVNDYLGFQLGSSWGRRGTGRTGHIEDPPRENNADRAFQQLSWKRILSSSQDFRFRFSHTLSDVHAFYVTSKPFSQLTNPALNPALIPTYFHVADQPVVIDNNLRNERYDLEFEHHLSPANGWRVAWGAESRQDRVEGAGYLARPSYAQRLSRLFLSSDLRLGERWTLNGGAMWEKNDLTAGEISPRLGLNFRVSPNNALRLSATRAYRTPSVVEEHAAYALRFANGQVLNYIAKSSGGLKPEEITSYELGLNGHTDDQRISYDLKLYREVLRDLIATPLDRAFPSQYPAIPCTSPYDFLCRATVMVNDGAGETRGAELQVKVRPTPRSFVSFAYSAANSSGQILTGRNPTVYTNFSELVPSETMSMLGSVTSASGVQFSLGYYHVSRMQFIGSTALNGYQSADFRIAKAFHQPGLSGKVYFSGHDILGSYQDYSDTVYRDRAGYVGIEFTL